LDPDLDHDRVLRGSMTRRIPLVILGILVLPIPRGHAQEDAPSPPPTPVSERVAQPPDQSNQSGRQSEPAPTPVTERLAQPYSIDLLPDELDVPLTPPGA